MEEHGEIATALQIAAAKVHNSWLSLASSVGGVAFWTFPVLFLVSLDMLRSCRSASGQLPRTSKCCPKGGHSRPVFVAEAPRYARMLLAAISASAELKVGSLRSNIRLKRTFFRSCRNQLESDKGISNGIDTYEDVYIHKC